MVAVALVRILSGKLRKFKVCNGSIQLIEPHFARHSPLKTGALACSYAFWVKDAKFEGQVILPLSFFLPAATGPGPVIVFDSRIELPILFYGKQRLVGTELIEHLLLNENDVIPVRYNLRDPSRHNVIVTGDSEKTRSARNIKSSDVL